MRYVVVLAILMVALVAPSRQRTAAAPLSVPRCFNVPGITDCITNPTFDSYWAGNGALPVFGYPITDDRPEHNRDLDQTFATQWFERNRLEAHPENQAPYHVLLGRLGAELLAKQGRGVEAYPHAVAPSGRCRNFTVTGTIQPVCDPFLRYWESHGLEFDGQPGVSYNESLALFGLPLTFVKSETNPNGHTVPTQWFERARFEDHGANGVLLGLLGRETLSTTPMPTNVYPIIEGNTGFLLGGTSDTAWLDAATTARAMRGGENYRLYALDGFIGPTVGSAPERGDVTCSDTFLVDLAPRPDAEDYIAVGGNWNARPRGSTSLSTQSEVYRSAIREFLITNGIVNPDVRLTQILRVDLEGDGVDEVLISAVRLFENGNSPEVKAGDYALVVLRKVINGTVETLILEEDYYFEDDMFVAPQVYTVTNLLDLNGDGRMEVVVDSSYYEGLATLVYNVSGRDVQVVVGAGCGL